MSGNRVGESNRISSKGMTCDSFKAKYSCPLCGSPIQYWKEYIITKSQVINPVTGKLGGVKTDNAELDHMTGYQCTKCSWILNDVLDSVDDLLAEWYKEYEKNIKV